MLITSTIPQRNYELIGVRIGLILATEFPGQSTTVNIPVWHERLIQFGADELPAVNISFSGSQHDEHYPTIKRATNTYNIDIHVSAAHTDTQEADKEAAIYAQKIAGIIDYILSSPHYLRLGYEPGVISSRWISEIKMGRMSQGDAMHSIACRIVYNVIAYEVTDEIGGTLIEEVHLSATLDETDLGYKFKL